MKKKAISLLLSLVMILSLLPTAALADPAPTATKRVALAAPTGTVMSNGNHADDTTVVYYGGIPWVVLTMEYDSNGDSTPDGPLLLSEYAYCYGTQWLAYRTDSDRSGTDQSKGYLASDIRGYLNGSNAQAKAGGPSINTFTAFRPAQYYGDLAASGYYTGFWERVTVTEDAPAENTAYFVKDSTKTYIGTGVTFASADEFNAATSGNELYTRSGSNPYTYTPAETWTNGVTYYYETTPYVAQDVSGGFQSGTTYYTFKKPTAFLKVGGANASANVAKAYYYAGYSVTGLNAASRTILAGMETGNKTLADDLGLGTADLAALNEVTVVGRTTGSKYTTTTNVKEVEYYGGALAGDKLFLLSAEEADIYLPSIAQRIAKYGSAVGTANWWLRSSRSTGLAAQVTGAGKMDYDYTPATNLGVRPAFNLNLNSVIFTSAASGTSGKSAVSEVNGDSNFVPLAKNTDTAGYKLTLKDETDFGVEAKLLKKNADASYTVAYENAKLPTDAENVYVSAIITDATGEYVYGYTKLAAVTENNQSGTATFVLPEGVTLGDNYVLKVFEEQCNDWSQNDYASVPVAMTVSAISEITEVTTATAGKTFEAGTDGIVKADLTVKAKYANNYVLTLTVDDFTIDTPANYDTTFHVQSAPLTSASQEQNITVKSAEDITKTKVFGVTVTGQTQAKPSLGIEKGTGVWNVTGLTADMEYNTDNGTAFTAVDPTAGLSGENMHYYVRYKAAGNKAPGTVLNLTLPAAAAATYAVTVNYTKDGSAWTPADKTVDLIGQNTAPSYFDYKGTAVVVEGTYDVHVNNAGSTTPVDTGVNVTVTDADTSATVPFVTMTFDYNVGEEADDKVPVLSGVAYDAAAEAAKAATYATSYSLDYVAFADAAPYTVTAAKTVKAQYTVNAATAAGTLSITTLTNGNAIPTPTDVKLTYGGVEYQQTSWEVNGAAISGNAVFGTAYTYKAVFAPADGYTFGVEVPTGLDASWSLESGNLVKTFTPITAGYPITVNGLPANTESVSYTLSGSTAVTVPVTSGTAILSAPAAQKYAVVVKDNKDVTYVGSVDLTALTAKTVSCVSTASAIPTDELLQQAPALTMTPNKDSTDVTLSQKSVLVTFDQDITLIGSKAQMYVYSTDGNRENDVYIAVYEQTITAAMYDDETRALELQLASFRSGSSYLTTLTSGYSYKLVLAEGTVKSVNGVSLLDSAEFSAYFKPSASLGFTVQLLKPLNGNVYAYRTGNTSVTTGTGTLTAAMGDTVTVYTRPDVGYLFDSYTYKWNGAVVTQDVLVANSVLTVDPDNSSIVYIVADAASTIRVVANFKLDTGITDYTVTQEKTGYIVCVGSNVTLSYVVTPGGAALAFESSNSDVAAVSGSTVYGIGVGTANITAKDPYDNVVATWAITVAAPQTGRPTITTNAASSISTTGATLSGSYSGAGFIAREVGIALRTVGGTTQYFKMSSIPSNGNVSVAVSNLAPGATYYYSVYVTTANGSTYTDSVYSYADYAGKFTTLASEPIQPVVVSGVSVDPTSTTVYLNSSVKLSEIVAPANATNKAVTWTSGDESVATVSANGVITGIKAGIATITVTTADGSKTATCTVTVKEATTVFSGGGGGGVSSAQVQKAVEEALAKQKAETVAPFTDVAKSAYYYDAVQWAYKNGITDGMTATTFGPDSTVNRAQIVTFLWRASGCPTSSKSVSFGDIDTNEYYYTALRWAVEKGITVGTSATTFSPNGTCTNAQIITMIWRAMNGNAGDNSSAVKYYDAAIAWANSNKLLDGTYTGTYDVKAGTPRCNVVEYLYRYFVK